jgi:hypothetical protein
MDTSTGAERPPSDPEAGIITSQGSPPAYRPHRHYQDFLNCFCLKPSIHLSNFSARFLAGKESVSCLPAPVEGDAKDIPLARPSPTNAVVCFTGYPVD